MAGGSVSKKESSDKDRWRIIMQSVSMFYESIEVKLQIGPDICDITPDLGQLVQKSDIKNGSLYATMVGSTGSITTI